MREAMKQPTTGTAPDRAMPGSTPGQPVPTPLPSSFNTAFIKHTMDFTFTLTRNQPITTTTVTHVFQKVFGWPRQKAEFHMLQGFTPPLGPSPTWVTPRDK